MSNFGVKKKKRLISLFNKEKGFALVVTILIMVLLTVMGLGILVVSDIESKIGANFRSHTQALYIAESGIERVISYFNNPASFTDVTGTYNGYVVSSMTDAQRFFAKRRLQGIVPSFFNIYGLSQFEDTDDNGVIDSPPHDYTNPVLKYNRDTSSAQEDFLESITPDASDQCYIYELMVFAPPPAVGAVATVRVTARVRNASRTVEQILMPGPILAFTSGLASGAGASWSGCSLLVHWGEVKIQGTSAWMLGSVAQIPIRTPAIDVDASPYGGAQNEDHWIRSFLNGVYTAPAPNPPDDTFANPPLLEDQQNVNQYLNPHSNLFSNQAITIDVWNYAVAKRTAQRYGTYYTTDNSGRLYLDGKGSPLQFESITDGRSCGIMFVDTIDQLPPQADGSNLATISFSGLYHTSGIFYIAANFSTAGLGEGGTTNVLAPPILQSRGSISINTYTLTLSGGETTNAMKVGDILLIGKPTGPNWDVEEFRITNVVDAQTLAVVATTSRVQFPPGPPPGPSPAYDNHNNENFIITTTTDESTRQLVSGFKYNFCGAVYCAGQIDMAGQPKVFGTVTAERGYAAAGNPEVWYDWNFSKGDLTQYGVPTVVKGAWREIY